MTSTNPWVLQQPSRLLRALLASSSSVGCHSVGPSANNSRITLLHELQQFPETISSPLPHVSLGGIEGDLVLPSLMRNKATRFLQHREDPTEKQLQDDQIRLPLKKRMTLSHTHQTGGLNDHPETVSYQKDVKAKHSLAGKSSSAVPERQAETRVQAKPSNRNSSAEQHWDNMFLRLLVYKTVNGDCMVPKDYANDLVLGKWVYYQRKLHKRLKPERKKRLQEIGFVFCLKKRDSWEVMYQQLVKYKNQHGHCLVPQNYKENKKLGKWVAIQRFNKHSLSNERMHLLNKIGFVWSANRAMWNTMFQSLVEYKVKNGTCRVPYNYEADPALANWVRRQRQNKKYLSSECLEMLKAIGFDL